MGTCKYCGKPAGLLKGRHAVCELENQKKEMMIEEGEKRIVELAADMIMGKNEYEQIEKDLDEIEKNYLVSSAERIPLLLKGWENAVERILEDGILDRSEEDRVIKFQEQFKLSQNELDKNGALTKIARAGLIRDLLEGKMPKRISLDGKLPINFLKGEQIIWAFSKSLYYEDQIKREFVGRSQGMSIRIMKGMYYRAGVFKGHAVERTERVHVDIGWVVVTNKNFYFAGPKKSVRIPFNKIVSYEPYSDGIGLIRDSVNAKPQIFVTGDGWFIYNIVMNISNIEE